MRPGDSDGFREAWAILERLWEDTVARAKTFPAAALHLLKEEWEHRLYAERDLTVLEKEEH